MDPFIGRRLSEITKDDLTQLIDRGVSESIGLDYKEELSIEQQDSNQANNAKRKFLQDLTAMANTNGGLMLYGIDERREGQKKTGMPSEAAGIDINSTDEFIRKIEHLLRDGVDEPLPGNVEIQPISVEDGKHVIAIRIPKSYRAPHRVTVAKSNDFYRRTNGGKEPMTTAQIRDAVLASETQYEQARAWSHSRWSQSDQLKNHEGWMLHYVPILRQANQIDFQDSSVIDAVDEASKLCLAIPSHNVDHRWCFEGRLARSSGFPKERVLIFRDGSVEYSGIRAIRKDHQNVLNNVLLEKKIIKACEALLSIIKAGGSVAPGYLSLRLFVPEASAILVDSRARLRPNDKPVYGNMHDFEQPLLGPIEAMIHGVDVRADQIAKPLLDRIWNTANYSHCLGYNNEGEYVGYKH